MVKRHALGLLVLLAAFATAQAQQKTDFSAPKQSILGAEKAVPLGKLVRLRVSPIDKPPDFLVSSSYTWKVYDGTTEMDDVVDLNGSIFFGAGVEAKTLTAHCVATHLYIVKTADKDKKVTITEIGTKTVWVTVQVTIGNPPPPTPPGPDPGPSPPPGPSPDPSLPDGKYKMAAAAYKFANTKVANAESRRKGAVVLSKSYRGLASKIAAGAEKEFIAALKNSKDANNAALKDANIPVKDWNDFGLALMDSLYEKYMSKSINSTADLGVAFGEISDGLANIK